MEMVVQCCLNKDRHATTIPVLRALGKLCRTRVKQNGKSTNTTTTTLLVHCLKSILEEWSVDMIRDNLVNITTFIKTCSEGLVRLKISHSKFILWFQSEYLIIFY